jgi:hypothetical protein
VKRGCFGDLTEVLKLETGCANSLPITKSKKKALEQGVHRAEVVAHRCDKLDLCQNISEVIEYLN